MNTIVLKGIIKNITPSHTINDVEYCKADLIVTRKNGKEDVLSIRFKKFSNPYKDNQLISLKGNVRSYSREVEDGKHKVELYVFTYFDIPELDEEDHEIINKFTVDGRICKKDALRISHDGKPNIHFVLANNLYAEHENVKLNSYLPTVAFAGLAKKINDLPVGTKLSLTGELHSREYKKKLDNGEYEIRVAHELSLNRFELL